LENNISTVCADGVDSTTDENVFFLDQMHWKGMQVVKLCCKIVQS